MVGSFWRQSNTSYISVFVHDVMFYIMERMGQSQRRRIRSSSSSPGGGTRGAVCSLWLHLVTGPPTHSVGWPELFCPLAFVVVCNTPRRLNVTHQGAAPVGGLVVLRPLGWHSRGSVTTDVVSVWGAASGGCSDNNGGCEQLCVSGYRGHFYCRCMAGYELMVDQRSCRGQLPAPWSCFRLDVSVCLCWQVMSWHEVLGRRRTRPEIVD